MKKNELSLTGAQLLRLINDLADARAEWQTGWWRTDDVINLVITEEDGHVAVTQVQQIVRANGA